VSRARPSQLAKALVLLARHLPQATPVVFGRAVGRPDETLTVTTLVSAGDVAADMATLVIVGSRETRLIARPGLGPLVYTPRAVECVSA
jgi:precorrin-3B C17-methyltransferase